MKNVKDYIKKIKNSLMKNELFQFLLVGESTYYSQTKKHSFKEIDSISKNLSNFLDFNNKELI